jgi:hypothetical protein
VIAVRQLATVLLAIAAGACTPSQRPVDEVLACPDQQLFTSSVSEYMERRCGTLDCHGSPARPMRLYGQYGLRHPEEPNWSGGAATTFRERAENSAAVCGVGPALFVVDKARGIEGHKGGTIMTVPSPEDTCLAGWLLQNVAPNQVSSACPQAIQRLSPH